jgi:Tfp pilus assembly protein PilN
MIRINLLGEAKPVVHGEPSAGGGPSPQQGLVFGASLMICLGVVGILGWLWSRQVTRLQQEVSREKAEQTRLVGVQAENARYQQEIHQLETRTSTIQAIDKDRTGPVELMNALADTVNDTSEIYLLSVGADGERLLVKGQSPSAGSIADFLGALKRQGSFHDVHLRQYYQEDEKESVNFKFDLDCVYAPGGSPAASAPSAPAVPAPPTRATGGLVRRKS